MKICMVFLIFLATACSSKDPKMCDCLVAGEKLNQFSANIMMKEITEKDAKEMLRLKADKTKKCEAYQQMSGEEMLKRKAECEGN